MIQVKTKETRRKSILETELKTGTFFGDVRGYKNIPFIVCSCYDKDAAFIVLFPSKCEPSVVPISVGDTVVCKPVNMILTIED